MPTNFNPIYTITTETATYLMRIEAVKQHVTSLPISLNVLASLRETAKLYTTHYSTMIEGNRLTLEQVRDVVILKGHFPGRERDEREVKGYYAALDYLEHYAREPHPITQNIIQTLHALVVNDGRTKVTPTPYRDGQNVMRDSATGAIVYLPPEAHDVADLMKQLVTWMQENKDVPCPIVAAIAHYQYATIHPYYDGNGRTARLFATLILHKGGYDIKGLYSLEEYYAQNLPAYYRAISTGPSHNYYFGRAEADITHWITYFLAGMAFACEKVMAHILHARNTGAKDQSALMRTLDPRQRKVLELFHQYSVITSAHIGALFGFQPRTNAALCKKWVDVGFLEIANPSNKARTYKLAPPYDMLVDNNE